MININIFSEFFKNVVGHKIITLSVSYYIVDDYLIMLVVSITLLRIISLSIIVIFCSHLDCGKLKHLLYLPDIFR